MFFVYLLGHDFNSQCETDTPTVSGGSMTRKGTKQLKVTCVLLYLTIKNCQNKNRYIYLMNIMHQGQCGIKPSPT